MSASIKIKESTLKRCKVTVLDAKGLLRFSPISLEFFHFLYQAKSINFSIYFRAQETMIEYIRPDELCKQLLDELWEAAQKQRLDLEICVLRSERAKFDALINAIRREKLTALRKKVPTVDQKTLDLYSGLSQASQMIVAGGIDAEVALQVKASASFLVTNELNSDVALSTLSRMIICDPTLYDHSASVAMLATMIAMNLLPQPLSQKQTEILAQCALYHDVGKTCVPQAILNKPGKFTPAEFEVIKQHAELGSVELENLIANGANIDKLACTVAHEHHEKWDGKGYPRGLCGAAEKDPEHGIHLFSRIVTIADIYSALLMKRVYKPAFEPQDAIKVMAAEASGFDPDLFLPFLQGIIASLNSEQKRSRGSRILYIDEAGELAEWKENPKAG